MLTLNGDAMGLFSLIHQFSKKYLFLLPIIIPFHTFASDAKDISTIMLKMDDRFSGIASTKKIGTMGVDSMNIFFETVLKKIPSISTLMRINSNGTVINEISSENSDFKMRDVSDQRWFLHAKNTRTSYFGTTRDSSGTTLFFWAWPIIANDSVFNGVITAKIKPSGILAMAKVDPETPIGLFLNSQVVYKQNYAVIGTFISDTVPLSSISNIIIQTENHDSALALSDTGASDTMKQSETTESDSVLTSSESTSSAPVVYKSDFLEPAPQKRHAPVTIILTLLLSLLFLFAAVFVILKNRSSQKTKELTLPEIDPEELKAYKISSKPFEEETIQLSIPDLKESAKASEKQTTIDKNVDNEVENDTDHIVIATEDEPDSPIIDNDSLVFVEHDDETRSHPPVLLASTTGKSADKGVTMKQSTVSTVDIQEEKSEIIYVDNTEDESALNDDLLDTSAEISPQLEMRNTVYEEVHNEVVYWITSEANRLDNRIEEIEKRLAIIEKLNTPEIHQIRKDINDMSRDIKTFRTGKDVTGDKVE